MAKATKKTPKVKRNKQDTNRKGQKTNTFGLIEKHAKFCEFYIITLNGSQSAIDAGFAPKSARVTASKLLTNPNIEAYIQHLRNEQSERTKIDADYVLGTIVNVMQAAQQGNRKEKWDYEDKCMKKVIIETDDGVAAEVWERDNNAVLKGAELLGKHLNLWKETLNLQNNGKDLPEQKVTNVVKLTINHRASGQAVDKG